jgi:serine/threonine protein phosphatase PrpC
MIYPFQQFRVAYSTHRWVRRVTSTTLLVYVIALYWLPGGFPPWAWRVLFQLVPALPRLWALQGVTFVFPFVVLLLYSLSLLFLWGVLLFATIKMAQHWLQELRGGQKQRSFGSGTQQSVWIAQEMARKATTTTEGRTQRPSSPASFTTTGSGRKASSSVSSTNGQRTHTRTPVFSEHQADVRSMAGQQRDQRQPADRLLSEARSLPTTLSRQSSFQSFSERTKEVSPMQSSTIIALHIGGETDPGLTRAYAPNEDTILVIEESHVAKGQQFPIALVAIADGMGGHANGQQASQTAISILRDTLLPALRSSETSEMACIELLHIGVQRANAALYEQNKTHFWMGTTLTAALIFGATAHLVNVGDSRTYLYRPAEGLCRVTHDHSLVEELVAAGLIESADIYTHPYRNQLTRCLGNEAEVKIDSFTALLSGGDVLLLCSDGLWEMVRDPDIEHMVAPSPRNAQHLAQLLIQAALNRGGKDNVSVIVVERARAG